MLSETSAANKVGLSEAQRDLEENEVVISARSLGKRYAIYDSPKDKLKEVFFFGRRNYHRDFWALRDVSFDIRRGETVGIIGRNGSGKSTLLQILCGTLAPTVGTVEIRGRVSALLELGSGFNPEFTGKENVYMNAAILGLSKEEIDSRYQSIVDFADIGAFIDQPVRKYSSGMYVRLAFSVAINVDPDILVIDEALAVGDEIFQRKCFSRMSDIRANGATILFVSHSASIVIELCDRAVLLDAGEAILRGSPKVVVSRYHQLSYAPPEKHRQLREQIRSLATSQTPSEAQKELEPNEAGGSNSSAPEAFYDPELLPQTSFSYVSRGAQISNPRITTLDGRVVNNLAQREDYVFSYEVDFTVSALSVRAGMLIKTPTGLELGGTVTSSPANSISLVEAGTRLLVSFKFRCLLSRGAYFLNAGVEGVVDGTVTYLDRRIDVLPFKVFSEMDQLSTGVVDFCIEPNLRSEPCELLARERTVSG